MTAAVAPCECRAGRRAGRRRSSRPRPLRLVVVADRAVLILGQILTPCVLLVVRKRERRHEAALFLPEPPRTTQHRKAAVATRSRQRPHLLRVARRSPHHRPVRPEVVPLLDWTGYRARVQVEGRWRRRSSSGGRRGGRWN